MHADKGAPPFVLGFTRLAMSELDSDSHGVLQQHRDTHCLHVAMLNTHSGLHAMHIVRGNVLNFLFSKGRIQS